MFIHQNKKRTAAEVTIKTNIKAFTLGVQDIIGYDKEMELLTRVIRYADEKAFEYLQKIGFIKTAYAEHNLITTVGRNVLARLLAGDATYSGEINYGALGTGLTAPANADTTLDTEVYRKLKVSAAADDNITYVDFVYTASDTSGTYEEFGNFIDGAVGADTGRLFSRILTGGWVKTNAESLFISCRYTIT